MEIHQDKGTIHLTQEKYLQKVIDEFKVEKTYDSPHDQTLFDLGDGEDALEGREKDEFRSRVMKIAYLAHRTRPDILLACNFLSTQIEHPTQKSLQDLDRVVGYLEGEA